MTVEPKLYLCLLQVLPGQTPLGGACGIISSRTVDGIGSRPSAWRPPA